MIGIEVDRELSRTGLAEDGRSSFRTLSTPRPTAQALSPPQLPTRPRPAKKGRNRRGSKGARIPKAVSKTTTISASFLPRPTTRPPRSKRAPLPLTSRWTPPSPGSTALPSSLPLPLPLLSLPSAVACPTRPSPPPRASTSAAVPPPKPSSSTAPSPPPPLPSSPKAPPGPKYTLYLDQVPPVPAPLVNPASRRSCRRGRSRIGSRRSSRRRLRWWEWGLRLRLHLR
jgi:hypothetical protein